MARIRPARNDGSSNDDGGESTPPPPPARARRSKGEASSKNTPQPPRPKPASQRTKTGSVTKEVQDKRRGSRFLSDVIAELRKVQWPTRPQLIQSTAVVILVVAIVTVYLDIVDTIVSRIVHAIF
jgi:preprotein translocase subunit SecE